MGSVKLVSLFATLAFWLLPVWCDKTVSVEVCETKYGPSSVKSVGTTTASTTIHQTVGCVATITPTYTVQPTPKTITAATTVYVTKTTTLPNTKVSTLTSTKTVQSTVSVTNTITSTVSIPGDATTVTAAQTTVTIPTSNGFTPVNSVLNVGPTAMDKRQLDDLRPDIEERNASPSTSSGYPATVTCGLLVDIIATNSKTVTATKTSTVTAKTSTITKVSITTSTLTSTVCPAGASTTVTVTTTLAPITSSFTTTSTTTTTSSMTVTVQQPAATFYAACAADNLVSEIYDSAIGENGNLTLASVTIVNGNHVYAQTVLTANNAYDCCVQCITNDDCGGGYFQTDGSNTCVFANPVIDDADACDPTSMNVAASTNGMDLETDSLFTVFDGYCGQVYQDPAWIG